MRNLLLGALILGLLVGCASKTVNKQPVANDLVEADLALEKFGLENSNCQLWTNWQKMCYRIGENGEAHCQIDPVHPVEPSESFCVDDYLGEDMNKMPDAQIESVLRFCEKPDGFDTDVPNKDGVSTKKHLRLCRKFIDSRPFNGRSVSSIEHPWCSEWSDFVTKEKVCQVPSSDSESGVAVKNCSEVNVSKFEHKNLLSCSKQELPDWCARASFRAYIGPITADSGEEVILVPHAPLPPPVIGLHCGYTKKFDALSIKTPMEK